MQARGLFGAVSLNSLKTALIVAGLRRRSAHARRAARHSVENFLVKHQHYLRSWKSDDADLAALDQALLMQLMLMSKDDQEQLFIWMADECGQKAANGLLCFLRHVAKQFSVNAEVTVTNLQEIMRNDV